MEDLGGDLREELREFEFDLSDNVAAFESVATEDPIQEQQQQQQSQEEQQQQQLLLIQQQSPPKQIQSIQDPDNNQELSNLQALTTNSTSYSSSNQQAPASQQQQQHQQQLQLVNQASPLATQGRILLVPINSKQGVTGAYKQLYQLTGASPTATLTTAGNKKQIIQLAPISTSSLNLGKNNYSLTPIATTNQLLPSSSQGQQSYFTVQRLPLKLASVGDNSNLKKSLTNSQITNSVTPQLSTGNLTVARYVPFNNNDNIRVPTPVSNIPNEVPKRKPCNCTKSQCLKLYCDCFANGEFCSGCNCTNCFNSLSKEKERQKAISQCLERNPEAFRPKIGKAIKSSVGTQPVPESIERRHTKGCNCKRSGCLKNYCECYEAKILCSNLCKCCGCKNYEESFERKSLMQLANSASESARDKVIHASLVCLLQSAQQAEKDGTSANNIPNLIQSEMGKCLRMIVDSATDTSSLRKR